MPQLSHPHVLQNFEAFVVQEPVCTGYEGDYHNEKRHGNGRSVYRDGSVYDGEWRTDSKHGFGLMKYPDGSTYEGEWKQNFKHGYGVYIYENGDKYEGQWYNGSRHGIGTYAHIKEDCLFHGTWSEGQRIGPAEIRNKNYRFHTNWIIDRPVGVSAFTFNCDTMITGFMDRGSPNKMDYSSGDLQWHTQEISKYDRTKLPAAPSIYQFNDLLNDEFLHEIKPADDESVSSVKLQSDDLNENTNIITPSVATDIDKPMQEIH